MSNKIIELADGSRVTAHVLAMRKTKALMAAKTLANVLASLGAYFDHDQIVAMINAQFKPYEG